MTCLYCRSYLRVSSEFVCSMAQCAYRAGEKCLVDLPSGKAYGGFPWFVAKHCPDQFQLVERKHRSSCLSHPFAQDRTLDWQLHGELLQMVNRARSFDATGVSNLGLPGSSWIRLWRWLAPNAKFDAGFGWKCHAVTHSACNATSWILCIELATWRARGWSLWTQSKGEGASVAYAGVTSSSFSFDVFSF